MTFCIVTFHTIQPSGLIIELLLVHANVHLATLTTKMPGQSMLSLASIPYLQEVHQACQWRPQKENRRLNWDSQRELVGETVR